MGQLPYAEGQLEIRCDPETTCARWRGQALDGMRNGLADRDRAGSSREAELEREIARCWSASWASWR